MTPERIKNLHKQIVNTDVKLSWQTIGRMSFGQSIVLETYLECLRVINGKEYELRKDLLAKAFTKKITKENTPLKAVPIKIATVTALLYRKTMGMNAALQILEYLQMDIDDFIHEIKN